MFKIFSPAPYGVFLYFLYFKSLSNIGTFHNYRTHSGFRSDFSENCHFNLVVPILDFTVYVISGFTTLLYTYVCWRQCGYIYSALQHHGDSRIFCCVTSGFLARVHAVRSRFPETSNTTLLRDFRLQGWLVYALVCNCNIKYNLCLM